MAEYYWCQRPISSSWTRLEDYFWCPAYYDLLWIPGKTYSGFAMNCINIIKKTPGKQQDLKPLQGDVSLDQPATKRDVWTLQTLIFLGSIHSSNLPEWTRGPPRQPVSSIDCKMINIISDWTNLFFPKKTRKKDVIVQATELGLKSTEKTVPILDAHGSKMIFFSRHTPEQAVHQHSQPRMHRLTSAQIKVSNLTCLPINFFTWPC